MVKTYMVLGFARLAKRGESKLMRFSTLNYTEKILSTLVHLLMHPLIPYSSQNWLSPCEKHFF